MPFSARRDARLHDRVAEDRRRRDDAHDLARDDDRRRARAPHRPDGATSNDYVSKFYPVRDLYETWVDARDFQPLRFEKHAREGRYESDEVEEFDLDAADRELAGGPDAACPSASRTSSRPSTSSGRSRLAVGQDVARRHVLAREDLQAQGGRARRRRRSKPKRARSRRSRCSRSCAKTRPRRTATRGSSSSGSRTTSAASPSWRRR